MFLDIEYFVIGETTLGAKGIFFQGRRERSAIPNQRSRTKEKKILWSHDARTSFPCHQIGTEFVLVRCLDITFEGVSDWTNRKTGSQPDLLRQAALRDFGPREKGITVPVAPHDIHT